MFYERVKASRKVWKKMMFRFRSRFLSTGNQEKQRLNFGYACRTLRRELPDFFRPQSRVSWNMFSSNVSFVDTHIHPNLRIQGKHKYRYLNLAVYYSIHAYFRQPRLEILKMEEAQCKGYMGIPPSVSIRFLFTGMPRFSSSSDEKEFEGIHYSQSVVGVFSYHFDDAGLIHLHRLESLNPKPDPFVWCRNYFLFNQGAKI